MESSSPPPSLSNPSDLFSGDSTNPEEDPWERLREAIMRLLLDEETRDGRLNPLQLINLAERNALLIERAVEHIRGVLGVIA